MDKEPLPAVAPKLKACVDTAIACLQVWSRANGQNWEALTNRDALLYQSLLTRSRSDIKRGISPIYPRSEFKGLLGEELTGRRWEKLLRWFSREIEPTLAKTCLERAEPMLYPGRASAPGGGHPDKSQAIYFLTFDRPSFLSKLSSPEGSAADSALGAARPLETEAPSSSAREAKQASDADATSPNASVDTAPKANPGKPEVGADTSRSPQSLPAPAGVFLSLPSGGSGGSYAGWLAVVALALVVATYGAPTSNPLTDELLRFVAAAREALSGSIVVRF